MVAFPEDVPGPISLVQSGLLPAWSYRKPVSKIDGVGHGRDESPVSDRGRLIINRVAALPLELVHLCQDVGDFDVRRPNVDLFEPDDAPFVD